MLCLQSDNVDDMVFMTVEHLLFKSQIPFILLQVFGQDKYLHVQSIYVFMLFISSPNGINVIKLFVSVNYGFS